MQYYQFHIGDYTTATVHLSLLEDLAYRRLLDLYYMTEEPLPNDIPRLSRRIRIDAEYIEVILNEFFELSEEGWENQRCNANIQAFHEFIEKQRGNGKKGGRPRKKPKKTQALPTANPPLTHGKPTVKPTITHNPLPITQDSEKTEKEGAQAQPVFDLLWFVIDVIEDKHDVNKRNDNQWFRNIQNDLRKMQIEDGISPERIEKAMEWYSKNEFFTAIDSGRTLRNCFSKLETAMKNADPFKAFKI